MNNSLSLAIQGRVQMGTNLNPSSSPYAILEITIPEGGQLQEMYTVNESVSTVHADWGDGIIEDAAVVDGVYSHFYLEGVYNAKFYTDYIQCNTNPCFLSSVVELFNVIYFNTAWCPLVEFEVINDLSLTQLYLAYCSELTSINVSNCEMLQTIDIDNSHLVNSIDIHNTSITQSWMDLVLSLSNATVYEFVYLDFTVQDGIRPTQSVIDAFVLAHPECELVLNPEI